MKVLRTLGKIVVGIVAGLAILFGLLFLLTMGDHHVAKTVAQDPSLPRISIAGVTYHGQTFGDPHNPVVIAVHGGPGGDYRSILSLQALADQYFVVFYDQRGSGLSPRVDQEEITLASVIADLDSIVDHYRGGNRVNLIGHSWGAMLTSAYLGHHPEKVDHAVLAEPGFLTSELAEKFMQATRIRFSAGILYHFVKTKFESLHVNGPDEHAADDYFAYQMNMYQGADHPQAGYRCQSGGPKSGLGWRFGSRAAGHLFQKAVDANGKFSINLIEGVDGFTHKVLFLVSECQTVIGVDWQQRQMEFFPNTEMTVIPRAGHEMFAENPDASIAAVRKYLNAPAY